MTYFIVLGVAVAAVMGALAMMGRRRGKRAGGRRAARR